MTGLRFGELAGLMVDRVNFIKEGLTVDRQWTADGFGPPKLSTSYRDIPMGEVAVRALAVRLAPTHPDSSSDRGGGSRAQRKPGRVPRHLGRAFPVPPRGQRP